MPKRPNVLLIVTDQQRYDTLHCGGEEAIETPHIDWLSKRGTRFTHAFCATPICSPARASLLSGLYPHQHGMVANHQPRPGCDQMHLSPDVKLIADYLKPEGYACGYTGKWHLGTGSDRRGFGEYVASHFDFDTDTPEQNEAITHARAIGVELTGRRQGTEPNPETFNNKTRVGPSIMPLADHPATLMCDRAMSFIQRHQHSDDPFMLVYSTHEPHSPFVSPRPFDAMYKPDDMPLPPTFTDKSFHPHTKIRQDNQLRKINEMGLSESEMREIVAAYYGQVSFCDHLVGRLVASLIDTGQLADTLVIFTSDHGEMMGRHNMLLKGAAVFDDLARIPLVIVPPGGLESESVDSALVSHIDLMPTILDWCGTDIPAGLDGMSLRPQIEASPDSDRLDGRRTGVVTEFHSCNWTNPIGPLRMWRTEEWKYVESYHGDHELYNLADDPHECRNLIEDPAASETLASLKAGLRDWCERTGDTWPDVVIPPEVPK